MVFDSVLKLRTFISISLLLLDHSHGTQLVLVVTIFIYYNALRRTGIFELVPSGQVYVCTQSDLNQLEVVCSSNESRFLEWSITFPASNNYMRSIWDTNVAGYVRPLTVGSVTFEFTITKNPLTSRVSASQISPILNGSVIMCREAIGNSAELVLHVVDATTAGLSV